MKGCKRIWELVCAGEFMYMQHALSCTCTLQGSALGHLAVHRPHTRAALRRNGGGSLGAIE